MAHEITKSDVFAEIRARGERAWHKLGMEIPVGLSVSDGFSLVGLDWETELKPVFTALDEANVGNILVPDFRAHVRKDNSDVLGIVGKDYKPVPNAVLASFADALVQANGGSELETAGSLRGGRRVFALVKLGEPMRMPNGDELFTYLLITNVHDGTGAFRAYFTTIRVVCANTYRYAETRSGGAGFWYRHDGDINSKLEEARKILGLARQKREKVAEEIQWMSDTIISPNAYFDAVYEATFGVRPEPKKVILTDAEQAQIGGMLLDQLLEKPADTLDEAIAEYDRKKGVVTDAWQANHDADVARGTLWGAFNAVTQYHDHQRGRGEIQEREMTDARVHSNLFGASMADKTIAHNVALSFGK